MRSWLARCVFAGFALYAPGAARAQDTQAIAACINGTIALQPSDPADLRDRLTKLRWPSAEHASAFASGGPAAVINLMRRDGDALVSRAAASGLAGTAPWDTVRTRLDSLEKMLRAARPGSWQLPDSGRAVVGTLRPMQPLGMADAVVLGGQRLQFDAEQRVASSIICAVARGAYLFQLDLRKDSLDALAGRYRQSRERWDRYAASEFSFTFVERLAASCRLWVLSWVLSPTTGCWRSRERAWSPKELDPPQLRTIFAHPSAGLGPASKGDSLYRTAAVMEWYGFLKHHYTASSIDSWGVSYATAHAEVGPAQHGGVIHVPWGKVGVFGRKGGKPVVLITGDVQGWIPNARNVVGSLGKRGLLRGLEQLRRAGGG